MKPIYLKIKGINSFVEECEIDFEELSSKGLFGIFGPTGSGKSTILDGMTLALYGEIARDTKLFVNNRSNNAVVSFIFQISGATNKRYKVEREFKRNENGGKPSSKGRLVELGEEEKILEDKVSKITSEIIKIIGLTEEDFSRTVVLPQGKFSEFLKLEGKEKRDMLERIFDLQKYGEELSRKIDYNLGKTRDEYNTLEGLLSSFDDIKGFDVKQAKEEIDELKMQKAELELSLKASDLEFQKIKEQYNKQLELKEKEVELEILEGKKAEKEELRLKIKGAEKIARQMPYINNYLQREEDLNNIAKAIKKTKLTIEDKDSQMKTYLDEMGKFEEVLKSQLNKLELKEKQILTLKPNQEARDLLIEISKFETSIETGKAAILEKEVSVDNSNKKLTELNNEKIDIDEQSLVIADAKADLDKKIDKIKKEIEALKTTKLAESISHTLKSGDNCPVCGNIFEQSTKKTLADFDVLESKLKQLEEDKKQVEAKEIVSLRLSGEKSGAIDAIIKSLEDLNTSLIKYNERFSFLVESKADAQVKVRKLLSFDDEVLINTKDELEKIKEVEKEKEELQQEINRLRIEKDNTSNRLEKIKVLYNQSNAEFSGAKAVIAEQMQQEKNAIKVWEETKLELEAIIEKSVDSVDINLIFKSHVKDDVIELWKKDVELYENEVLALNTTISNIKSYIKKPISTEFYKELELEVGNKKSEVELMGKSVAIMENNLKAKESRIKEEKEKRKEFEVVEKRLMMLKELKSLFAGKKFVSYVARNQLNYISKEASKRLMDISSGAYALEVDNDEKFVIIDYKNGGARRDVSSLSGGEIFIASFALSLALANHIQLKGANLELFFLDEGFGALDENLLDTVMESIEKIKSDKLAIGLISHVESIKKRLPIKLIVTPSEAGGAGSKVRVEYE